MIPRLVLALLLFVPSLQALAAERLPSHLLVELSDAAASMARMEQALPAGIASWNLQRAEVVPVFTEPRDPGRRNQWYMLHLNRWFRLKFAGETAEAVAARATTSADVRQVIVSVPQELEILPNDMAIYDMWGLTKMSCPAAWDRQHGHSSILVTTIDTGCKITHPDLAANMFINPAEDVNGNGLWDSSDVNGLDEDANGYIDDLVGWDFVSVDVDPSQQAAGEDYAPWDNQVFPDIHGHGTHVMGTAAGVTDNATGVAAASWNVTALPLRAGFAWINSSGQLRGSGYEEDFAAAVQYAADMGVRVISISFGGSYSNPAYETVINYARMNNVLIFGAAGNSNNSSRTYPGAYDSVVAVAATDRDDLKASFSSYGTWVDLSAPGVSVCSTLPNSTYTPYDYGCWSGTSMATPNAAAVAGLLFSYLPALTATQAISYLQTGSDNIDALNPTFIGQLGSGRVNAANTLTLACTGTTPAAPVMVAKVVSEDSLRLSWPPIHCASQYVVEFTTQSGGAFLPLATTSDTTVADLTIGAAQRFYRVIAVQ